MFITPDNLNIINLEFTDYCNAACPMCARFKTDGSLYREKVNQNHTTLATLQKRIPEKIIKQLKKVHSIGTYGDPAMAPECADIYLNLISAMNLNDRHYFKDYQGALGVPEEDNESGSSGLKSSLKDTQFTKDEMLFIFDKKKPEEVCE